MALQLPASFTNSYLDFASYPQNLIHRSTYAGALRTYKANLDDIAKKSFVTKDGAVNVPCRDLKPSEDGSSPNEDISLADLTPKMDLKSTRSTTIANSGRGSATTEERVQDT